MSARIDLRHLELIAAIRRAGGFNGASRALGVSQPTLSKSIARLEARLGFKLFERTGAGARPTPYAEHIADGADEILQRAAMLIREAEQMANGELGRLRIGVGPVARSLILPKVISVASERFPRLQFLTVQLSPQILLQRAKEGTLDVVFVHHEYAAAFGEMIRTTIFKDRVAAVAKPGHPLAGQAATKPSGLLDFPAVMATPTAGMLRWLGELDSKQAANLASALFTDDFEVIRQRLVTSDAISLLPRFLVDADLKSGALVELPVPGPSLVYECWMLTTPELWRLPVVKAIAEIARNLNPTRD